MGTRGCRGARSRRRGPPGGSTPGPRNRRAAGMGTVTLHPAAVLAALDAAADEWARENGIAAQIARKTSDPGSRDWLLRWSKQCFAEGALRGVLNVIDGRPLEPRPPSGPGAAKGKP